MPSSSSTFLSPNTLKKQSKEQKDSSNDQEASNVHNSTINTSISSLVTSTSKYLHDDRKQKLPDAAAPVATPTIEQQQQHEQFGTPPSLIRENLSTLQLSTTTTQQTTISKQDNCDSQAIQDQLINLDDKNRSTTLTKLDSSNPGVVTILHFNDCYNIEPSPQSSGAAGFLTAINQYRHLNPIILFSGDIISPSFISTFTKGEQMIPVLNDIGVHCAVFGNHEFDYGVDNLIEFVKKTSFPWLLSNVVDKETSNQLGDGEMYHIIETGGLKFGIIGLIEEEWLSTLSTIDSCDVIYEDFVVKGRQLAILLKSEPHNVDYVIALTHFRKPNDIRLADNVPEIDLILGGHDHDYEIINRPNSYIIKSGTDFREFSLISLKINPEYLETIESRKNTLEGENLNDNNDYGKTSVCKPIRFLDIERISCFGYPPNEALNAKLDKFVKSIDEKMGKVLGQFSCDLDGRFASIRNYETNLGNFVTDIMLASTHADLAILNSGTLRSDQIHPRGDFTMRDLFKILGFIDPIAVLNANGFQIWKALENGVCQWPKLEGRFPQVSGCSFIFDPKKPSMQRIDPKDIFIGDEELQLDKQYKLTTKDYLACGKDGYDILKECEVLMPGDESPDLTTSILNHFEAINIIKSNRRTKHRQSIICLSRNSIKKMLSSQNSVDFEQEDGPHISNESHCKSRGASSGVECDAIKASKPETIDSNSIHLDQPVDSTLKQSASDNNNNGTEKSSADTGIETGVSSSRGTNFSDETWDNFDPVMMPTPGTQLVYAPLASSPLSGSKAPTPKLVLSSTSQDNPPATIKRTLETPPSLSIIDQRQPRTKRMMSLDDLEHEQCKLNPQIEGRIRIYGIHVAAKP